jgi:hypothetical protein
MNPCISELAAEFALPRDPDQWCARVVVLLSLKNQIKNRISATASLNLSLAIFSRNNRS